MLKTLFLGTCALGLTACAQTGAPGLNYNDEAPVLRTGNPWFDSAQETLAQRKAVKPITGHAKNVILFIADGMDPTTVAAARIFDGQSRGEEGEENLLSFETFPNLAMSKTYTTDYQVPDSAGTMSAMMTGVKTKSGVLSLNDAVKRGDCASVAGAMTPTIGELAKQAGMSVGVISTARITHATPGAVYAHSADRGWEADSEMPDDAKAAGCKDIASQLLNFPYGGGIDLALGGGRLMFTPTTVIDPETDGLAGRRIDGRDLTAEWTAMSDDRVYVWNKKQFDAAPDTAKILGLFEASHMQYEADRNDAGDGEPSLAEMTAKAIDILSKNPDGYFLMVEGGRVDHAHHAGNAYRALSDAQAFAKAVAAARAKTREQDTLIIATADHGHTLSFQGYPRKGNNILGLATVLDDNGEAMNLKAKGDGKPYTTLAYANGPGAVFREGADLSKGRPAPDAAAVLAKDYRQQALVPTGGETHGGQDVTIYASGPRAYLFSGVVEQNYIFHVINDALSLMQRAGAAEN